MNVTGEVVQPLCVLLFAVEVVKRNEIVGLQQLLNCVFTGAHNVDFSVALGDFGYHRFISVKSYVSQFDVLAGNLFVVSGKFLFVAVVHIVRPVVNYKTVGFAVGRTRRKGKHAAGAHYGYRKDCKNAFVFHRFASSFLPAFVTLMTRRRVSIKTKNTLNTANQYGSKLFTRASS